MMMMPNKQQQQQQQQRRCRFSLLSLLSSSLQRKKSSKRKTTIIGVQVQICMILVIVFFVLQIIFFEKIYWKEETTRRTTSTTIDSDCSDLQQKQQQQQQQQDRHHQQLKSSTTKTTTTTSTSNNNANINKKKKIHFRNDDGNDDDGNSNGTEDGSSSNNSSLSVEFQEFLSRVPFDGLFRNWSIDDYDDFYTGIQAFVRQEPLVPINDTCTPPPLIPPEHIQCENYTNNNVIRKGGSAEYHYSTQSLFMKRKERREQRPAKIGHAIQFGSADVDTLEIHLNELYDVIDKFFIVEFVLQHNQVFPTKQLTWDHIKKQDRFRKFHNKIVHIVLDDIDVARMKMKKEDTTTTKKKTGKKSNAQIWTTERYQEDCRWNKIKQWNDITKYFGPDDIIGFGDTDEIASRKNIQILKHCQFNTPQIKSIDIGIWFPYGKLDQAFQSDFPVLNPKHVWTLGDPTYFTFQSAEEYETVQHLTPSRLRGKGSGHLLGGIHMSQYPYFPYLLLKDAMATESEGGLKALKPKLQRLAFAYRTDQLSVLQDQLAKPKLPVNMEYKIQKIKDIIPQTEIEPVIYLPWFYDCNRQRYPRWEGKPDSRLGL